MESTLADRLRGLAVTIPNGETRTLICEPGNAPGLTALLEHLTLSHKFTVRASTACLPGKLTIIDEAAIQTAVQEALRDPIIVYPTPLRKDTQ